MSIYLETKIVMGGLVGLGKSPVKLPDTKSPEIVPTMSDFFLALLRNSAEIPEIVPL